MYFINSNLSFFLYLKVISKVLLTPRYRSITSSMVLCSFIFRYENYLALSFLLGLHFCLVIFFCNPLDYFSVIGMSSSIAFLFFLGCLFMKLEMERGPLFFSFSFFFNIYQYSLKKITLLT